MPLKQDQGAQISICFRGEVPIMRIRISKRGFYFMSDLIPLIFMLICSVVPQGVLLQAGEWVNKTMCNRHLFQQIRKLPWSMKHVLIIRFS